MRQAAIAAVKQEREDAKYFTGGSVKVAVSEVKLKRSTGSHVAYANSTYVYV